MRVQGRAIPRNRRVKNGAEKWKCSWANCGQRRKEMGQMVESWKTSGMVAQAKHDSSSKQTSFWISKLIAVGKTKRTLLFSFPSHRDRWFDIASCTSVRGPTCLRFANWVPVRRTRMIQVPDLISARLATCHQFLTGLSK